MHANISLNKETREGFIVRILEINKKKTVVNYDKKELQKC